MPRKAGMPWAHFSTYHVAKARNRIRRHHKPGTVVAWLEKSYPGEIEVCRLLVEDCTMPKSYGSYLMSPIALRMARNLAVNVRAMRQARGWSIKELGARSSIPWRTLENIEAEETSTSSVALAWLAETFGLTMDRLMLYPCELLNDGRMRNPEDGRFIVPTKDES